MIFLMLWFILVFRVPTVKREHHSGLASRADLSPGGRVENNCLRRKIQGVSLDVKVDAWRKAIETDGLPWLHMSDLKGWNSIVTDVYQIHGIPMLFVLDENNRIVGEGLRGEELEKCVQKVLAQ